MLTKKRTNPLFDPEAFRLLAGEERAERALEDPDSIDLLVWNVFSTLERHSDPAWLAGRLQALGGPGVRAPVRISMFTGADREPLLEPPASYIAHVRERAHGAGGDDASVAEFSAPVNVPVRIESPDVVTLVDTVGKHGTLGHGGRERVVELIDVGLEQARRTGKNLAVAVLYVSGSSAASEVSARVNALRNDATLKAALPHRASIRPVVLREMSWQQLLRIWQTELPYMDLRGGRAKPFLAHCRDRGLL